MPKYWLTNPEPDIPSEYAKFVGTWHTDWSSGNFPACLAVVDVNKGGVAKIIYGWPDGYVRKIARIADGVLTFEGYPTFEFSFDSADDDKLTVVRKDGGLVLQRKMDRQAKPSPEDSLPEWTFATTPKSCDVPVTDFVPHSTATSEMNDNIAHAIGVWRFYWNRYYRCGVLFVWHSQKKIETGGFNIGEYGERNVYIQYCVGTMSTQNPRYHQIRESSRDPYCSGIHVANIGDDGSFRSPVGRFQIEFKQRQHDFSELVFLPQRGWARTIATRQSP